MRDSAGARAALGFLLRLASLPLFTCMRLLRLLGYDPLQFQTTLNRIAEGSLDVSPMITGRVDLDGVAQAFSALGDPEAHAKILVVPGA